jgi:Domain of unknown function (DUF4410)
MQTNTRTILAGTVALATAITFLAASASADITDRKQLVTGPLPQPGNILVYNFVATAADVPADSPLAHQPDVDTSSQTDEQIAEGRKLGEEIAAELVKEIQAMGMPAQVATAQTKPQTNDLVIRGCLVSIQEGDAAKRFTIGFGSGAAELKTVVEGFQMTAQGLRKLGSGTVDAKGGKAPGAAVGVAGLLATHNPAGLIVSSGLHMAAEETGRSGLEGRAKQTAKEIANALKQRFQEQGWIQ